MVNNSWPFFLEMMEVSGQWDGIQSVERVKNYQAKILYPAELSFRGEVK